MHLLRRFGSKIDAPNGVKKRIPDADRVDPVTIVIVYPAAETQSPWTSSNAETTSIVSDVKNDVWNDVFVGGFCEGAVSSKVCSSHPAICQSVTMTN
jgi:hypothetical protein